MRTHADLNVTVEEEEEKVDSIVQRVPNTAGGGGNLNDDLMSVPQ